jgi:hypothetical protein
MRNFNDFTSGFGDFQTLFLDTDLGDYVCRFYNEDGEAIYKCIVGYTELPNDILLHIVDCENVDSYDELDEAIEKHGVSFQTLTTMLGQDGFCIIPYDQFAEDEDEDEHKDDTYISFKDFNDGDDFDDDDDDKDCEYHCTNCGDCEEESKCEDDTWICHCGNVNLDDDLYCLKCGCRYGEMSDDCDYKSIVKFTKVMKEISDKFTDELAAAGYPKSLFDAAPNAEVNELFEELTGAMQSLLKDN